MDTSDDNYTETIQMDTVDEVTYEISSDTKKIYEKKLKVHLYPDCITIIIQYLIWNIKEKEIVGVYYPGTKKWHIGVVLKCSPNKLFIHYLGWGKQWDEWKPLNELMPYDHRLNCDIDTTKYSFYEDRLLCVTKGEKSTIRINKEDKIINGEITNYLFENGIWYIEYNTIDKYYKKIKNKLNYEELVRYSVHIQFGSIMINDYLFCERKCEE